MRRLIYILILLSLVVAAAIYGQQEPGYVLVSYGSWTIELTLVLFLILLFISVIAIYFGLRLMFGVIGLPADLKRWRKERGARRATRSLSQGLILIAEGNWKKAEKELLKHIHQSEHPLLNYIAAAQAAQGQGESARRDEYLKKADQSTAGADIAVGLTQANLQWKEGQLERALATLNRLRDIDPKHPYLLKKLIEIQLQLNDWKGLLEILPQAKRRKAISKLRVHELEREGYLRLLKRKVKQGNNVEIETVWHAMPAAMRKEPLLCEVYGGYLHNSDKDNLAEPVVRDGLKNEVTGKLAYLYGEIKTESLGEQIRFAEAIYKKTANHPMLTLALGKLCLKAELWGKAFDYLDKSMQMGPTAQGYQGMAQYYEKMGDKEKANRCYRDGLAVLLNQPE